ncbi:DNA-binding protein [Enterococcus dongliensis]|jgi:DNA-binding transcriptional regulator YiaG|uniref:DNA-binding protein n=1 Tax=Enterococcus TaxID=1350 RepID=UPI00288F8FA9|nr:DNA-binding protein [Enterococcus dongliensis]MDT2638652.1 DNA-binding protein [Enterococcus dongliensis]
MNGLQVMLSDEQAASLKQYVFELTKESIAEAKKVAGLDKPFLKQNEMAKYLGISVNSLRKLESYGLKTIAIDGLRLYSKEEAVKFLLEHQK